MEINDFLIEQWALPSAGLAGMPIQKVVEDGEHLMNMLGLPALLITPTELASSADADGRLSSTIR